MFFTYRISEQILFDFIFYISTNMEKRVDSLFKFLNEIYIWVALYYVIKVQQLQE